MQYMNDENIERWKGDEPALTKGEFVSPSRTAVGWFRLKATEHTWELVEDWQIYATYEYDELEALISELMDFRQWVIANVECETTVKEMVLDHASDDPLRD